MFKFATIREGMRHISGMRISSEAVEEVCKALDRYLHKLTLASAEMAKHAKRQTIRREDVILAYQITED